jgi:hypothetical protein
MALPRTSQRQAGGLSYGFREKLPVGFVTLPFFTNVVNSYVCKPLDWRAWN